MAKVGSCWLTEAKLTEAKPCPSSTTGPAPAAGLRRWPRAAALAGPLVTCAGMLLLASAGASLGCMLEVPGTAGALGRAGLQQSFPSSVHAILDTQADSRGTGLLLQDACAAQEAGSRLLPAAVFIVS